MPDFDPINPSRVRDGPKLHAWLVSFITFHTNLARACVSIFSLLNRAAATFVPTFLNSTSVVLFQFTLLPHLISPHLTSPHLIFRKAK